VQRVVLTYLHDDALTVGLYVPKSGETAIAIEEEG